MKKYLIGLLIIMGFSFAPFIAFADNNWFRPIMITPTAIPEIIFPVQGIVNFSDDFGDGRSGGRLHEGNDLMAPKMTPILAARGGIITSAPTIEPSYGYTITIAGDDGYTYNYLHINNDTPGTDDGLGGILYAYSPGITKGVSVIQGQQIAWVGDSGNAENVASHLHFEIRLPDDTAIDPFVYLNNALKIFGYDISAVKNASPNIDIDKGLVASTTSISLCTPGSLIRVKTISSVYYCGLDNKRYVFPNSQVYSSWYKDFSTVKVIPLEDMGKIRLGGNVTYRPGIKLVKIQTNPKVYAVDKNGTLRSVITPAIAEKYYGAAWNKNVDDIPDTFFMNYTIGTSINN
jgi:hypothetical protein